MNSQHWCLRCGNMVNKDRIHKPCYITGPVPKIQVLVLRFSWFHKKLRRETKRLHKEHKAYVKRQDNVAWLYEIAEPVGQWPKWLKETHAYDKQKEIQDGTNCICAPDSN